MGIIGALLDLVLPLECAGCGATGPDREGGLCRPCAAALAGPAAATRPTPAPAGLPSCVSAGAYDGVVREVILAYKERGRRSLARPLGEALAVAVAHGWPGPGPIVLVPVPGTAAAIRARHGDHMLRLAHAAAQALRRRGRAVAVARLLRARPKADSAHLDRASRAAAAREAFAVGPGLTTRRRAALAMVADRGAIVVVDDVLTTGATLAAVTTRLASVEIPVAFAATVAATRLRDGRDVRRRFLEGGD